MGGRLREGAGSRHNICKLGAAAAAVAVGPKQNYPRRRLEDLREGASLESRCEKRLIAKLHQKIRTPKIDLHIFHGKLSIRMGIA